MATTIDFFVGTVLAESDSTFRAVVLYSPTQDTTIELQRSEVEEPLAVTEMARYCIVHDGVTKYGGLESWEIGPNWIRLTVDEESADALELPCLIELNVQWKVPADLVRETIAWCVQ